MGVHISSASSFSHLWTLSVVYNIHMMIINATPNGVSHTVGTEYDENVRLSHSA